MGFRLVAVEMSRGGANPDPADLTAALDRLQKEGVRWIYVGSSSFLTRNADAFTRGAIERGIAVVSPYEHLVRESGALISVAAHLKDVGRLAAQQALRILRDGKSPGNLPIVTATEFAYVVNMDVARELNRVGIPATLGALLVLIVAMATVKAILLLVAQRQVGYTAARVATDLRLEVLRTMMRSRWSFFLRQPAGRLTNALVTEAQRAPEAYLNGTTSLTFFIQAIVYGSVALAVSWRATLLSLVAGAVVIGLSHFLVRVMRRAGHRQTELMSSLMAYLTDTLQAVKPLKAMARESQTDEMLRNETNRLNGAMRKQVLAGAALDAGQDLMFVALIAFGVYVAIDVLSMEFATVLILAVTLGRTFAFLGKVQKQYQKLAQSESAYWSLKETSGRASAEEEHLGGRFAPTLARDITLSDVRFAYEGHAVLDGLDLVIPAHCITTVIGPSGSGKTTVIDLVIGLLRPESGEIRIDGVPFETVDLRA
jgi:ATP-binding cassette subfamily C protein